MALFESRSGDSEMLHFFVARPEANFCYDDARNDCKNESSEKMIKHQKRIDSKFDLTDSSNIDAGLRKGQDID